MTFSWAGFMKVVVSGLIFLLQKRESHRSLSNGARFIIMLTSVSSFTSIDIGLRGLMFLWDLYISSLMKFIMRVRKEFGFWFRKFAIALISGTISRTPIIFRMLGSLFQTGLT